MSSIRAEKGCSFSPSSMSMVFTARVMNCVWAKKASGAIVVVVVKGWPSLSSCRRGP